MLPDAAMLSEARAGAVGRAPFCSPSLPNEGLRMCRGVVSSEHSIPFRHGSEKKVLENKG